MFFYTKKWQEEEKNPKDGGEKPNMVQDLMGKVKKKSLNKKHNFLHLIVRAYVCVCVCMCVCVGLGWGGGGGGGGQVVKST